MWISVNALSSCWRTASSTSCFGVYVYASACFCVTAKAQNLHFRGQTFVWFKYRFWTKKTRSSPPRCRRARSASSPRPSRSSDSISATPSSKSSRSPTSTFSRTPASVSDRSRRAINAPCSRPRRSGPRAPRGAARRSGPRARCAQAGARAACVGARDVAAFFERTGRRDAEQRSLELHSPGERVADRLVTLGGEQERQGRRSLAQVRARDLSGLDRHTGAVEDVVGDLEGDAERDPERSRSAREPGP